MMILGTIPGERVGEPTFGSRLFELVFEPNDKMLLSQLVHETADAISLWDSLIQIVNVTPEYGEDSVKLFIDYVDKADPTLSNRRATFSSQR
jgi:phage baseplate assembly protein W